MLTAPVHRVADVFALHGKAYRAAHKLTSVQRGTMYAIEHCRTAAMGGHAEKCDHCGHTRVFYNSCRNRHCPQCQGLKREIWVDKLAATLLPVKYFHIVFTIPCQINPIALYNQECIYDTLFKAASETIMTLAKDRKRLGALTGMVAVLHTWGQNLMDHPHLHTMVPAGGWDEMAQCWKSCKRKNFFIHVNIISDLFKKKFLYYLKQAYDDNKLRLEGINGALKSRRNFIKFKDSLKAMDWVVYSKSSFKKPTHLMRYLGNYTHRVAISDHRILKVDASGVIFLWKDYRNGSRTEPVPVTGEEFIRRFLLHVLPKGFCKIRYYGLFACRSRQGVLAKCREYFKYALQQSILKGLSRMQALAVLYGIHLDKCPVCKKGTMQISSLILPRRAPPLTTS